MLVIRIYRILGTKVSYLSDIEKKKKEVVAKKEHK